MPNWFTRSSHDGYRLRAEREGLAVRLITPKGTAMNKPVVSPLEHKCPKCMGTGYVGDGTPNLVGCEDLHRVQRMQRQGTCCRRLRRPYSFGSSSILLARNNQACAAF